MTPTQTSLLIPEPPYQLLPTLAKTIGVNEAIALQQLHYLGQHSKHRQEDGWVQLTVAQWADVFPFWGEATIKRTFASLERLGLIESAQPNGTDRRARRRVLPDLLPSDQFDPIERIIMSRSTGPDRSDPPAQPDPVSIGGTAEGVSSLRDDTQRQDELTAETTSPNPSASGGETAQGELDEIWSKVEGHLRDVVTEATWGTWMAPLRLVAIDSTEAVIEAPIETQKWIAERFDGAIKRAFTAAGHPVRRLVFTENKVLAEQREQARREYRETRPRRRKRAVAA